jgi:glycosyltransferase involved in cell wall biosynthesis
MRPLTVVQLVPALEAGGAERSTLEIADALVRAGHRAIVVSAGGRLVPELAALGAEHVTCDLGRKSLATLRHVRTLRRLLRRERADVVHARSRLPAWIARFALRGLAPRPHFVTTVHGLNSPGRYSAIMTRGERVICVSETVRRYVLAHYPTVAPARLALIPRGIDTEAFPRGHQAAPEWRERFYAEHPMLAGRRLLMLPARGSRLKGHADAIRALARLRERYNLDVALLLQGAREPGRDAYLAELTTLAADCGVGDALAIAPPRSDMRDVYAVSDAVLQVSTQRESFGRVVLEALAIGRPVIGYAHGGVGELLETLYPDGAVAVGDVEALAARAAAVLSEPPPVPPIDGHRLADMQAATLALYASLVEPGQG